MRPTSNSVGGDQSVAPRGMDRLEVRTVEQESGNTEVQVLFERFQTGKHEPIAMQ